MNEKNESVSVEERVGDALLARASLVTEETLRLPDELPGPRGHGTWPILAAVAAALAVVAGVAIVVAAVPLGDTMPAGPKQNATPTGPPSLAERTPPPPRCDVGKTCLIDRVDVNGYFVELRGKLRDKELDTYQDWVLREKNGAVIARGGPVTGDGARDERDYLPIVSGEAIASCHAVEGIPLCLLETADDVGDTFVAEAFSRVSSGWSNDMSYPLSLYTTYLRVGTLAGETTSVAISVENDENTGKWHARVWQWTDGKILGCTPMVDYEMDLPGWPEISPDKATIADQCGGYQPPTDGERVKGR